MCVEPILETAAPEERISVMSILRTSSPASAASARMSDGYLIKMSHFIITAAKPKPGTREIVNVSDSILSLRGSTG